MLARLSSLPLFWQVFGTNAAALSLAFVAAPAQAVYDRDGPYLDYSTTFALGVHGEIPKAQYSFGTFYTPGMTLLTNRAELRGLDYGYAFALINLAWAPGQAFGSAAGGAIAEETTDAVPYLVLGLVALLTLVGLRRSRASS